MTFINEAAREFEKMDVNLGKRFETLSEYREKVIRECIEALPKEVWPAVAGMNAAATPVSTISCRIALESLLPKPDRAQEIVDAWLVGTEAEATSDAKEGAYWLANWLIRSGKMP